jgi:hypothetical protein
VVGGIKNLFDVIKMASKISKLTASIHTDDGKITGSTKPTNEVQAVTMFREVKCTTHSTEL